MNKAKKGRRKMPAVFFVPERSRKMCCNTKLDLEEEKISSAFSTWDSSVVASFLLPSTLSALRNYYLPWLHLDSSFDYLLEFQLFLLEELRERKFDGYARKIQKAYRLYKSRQYFAELKQQGKSRIKVLAVVQYSTL